MIIALSSFRAKNIINDNKALDNPQTQTDTIKKF
jgi:hypothetical protein